MILNCLIGSIYPNMLNFFARRSSFRLICSRCSMAAMGFIFTSGVETGLSLEANEAYCELKAVMDQMTEGLIIFDSEGHVLDMHPAALKIQGGTFSYFF